jgi:glycerate kinase
MRIVVAPQEFKGSLTASEAAAAMAVGAREALPSGKIETVPMSDGGPGTVDAVVTASGGRTVTTTVRDPLGRPVAADWGTAGEETAVIEMAAAAGLLRLTEGERDPRLASTYGVGELVRAALDAGCRRLIVGQGGSATNDGGAGMAQALGVRFLDEGGGDLPPGGAALARLDRIDSSGLDPRLAGCDVVAATDVMNPLCGPEGASLVYGPQKGASPEVARELDAALRRYGEVVERDVGVSVLDMPGAGAAGGLGAGLIAFLGARIEPGVEVVAEVVRLRERVRGAALVLTGEGRLDGQTGYGKTVAGVARIAAAEGVPVVVVAGTLGEGWERILETGVEGVELIVPRLGTLEEAMERPAEMLSAATVWAVNGWLRLRSAEGKRDG